mmetsp:Transcript_28392/g.82127  ORF Transcript_28392/g.82127 Transcript_28392/m.82127 type:complete len:217 (-) Transcript_28392:357-1007(-)
MEDDDICPSVADCDLRWRLCLLVRPIPDDRIDRFCNLSCAATISSVGEEFGGGDDFGAAGEMGGKLPPLGEGRRGASEENPRLRRGSRRMPSGGSPPVKLPLPPELLRVSAIGGGIPMEAAAAAAAAAAADEPIRGTVSSPLWLKLDRFRRCDRLLPLLPRPCIGTGDIRLGAACCCTGGGASYTPILRDGFLDCGGLGVTGCGCWAVPPIRVCTG